MMNSASNLKDPSSSFEISNENKIIYPALNVYFSPRVHNGRIDHKNLPMCSYKRKI